MMVGMPKSKILMIAAWISDVIWLSMLGYAPLAVVGMIGFVVASIFSSAMFTIYRKGKATGRYTDFKPRPWKDQVW